MERTLVQQCVCRNDPFEAVYSLTASHIAIIIHQTLSEKPSDNAENPTQRPSEPKHTYTVIILSCLY